VRQKGAKSSDKRVGSGAILVSLHTPNSPAFNWYISPIDNDKYVAGTSISPTVRERH
jgi:hypothetical protein